MVRKNIKFLFSLFIVLFFLGSSATAGSLHQQWTDLLSKYVHDGVVDYQGFKDNQVELESYLDFLARTDPEQLSESDQLAFYINAYNAYTVKLILDHFKNGKPPESIRRIGGLFSNPWKISFAVLAGKTYSLDNIEHDIIRIRFNEARIHFAVNCASKSCPILISEAYEGAILEQQLERVTKTFLTDHKHNYLEGDTLYVSSIFKWYKEDYNNDPLTFFTAHSNGSFLDSLENIIDDINIKYLDYDWSLNAKDY